MSGAGSLRLAACLAIGGGLVTIGIYSQAKAEETQRFRTAYSPSGWVSGL